MVKSMLDLRQLETFSHKKNPNCPPHDRERQSTPSLQEPMVCMDLCLRERNRSHACVIALLNHLCSLSAAAVGGESQEASALATRWLAVLTPVQGHQGGRWSCAVPWGERGWYKSTEQVNPCSVHAVSLKRSQGHCKRTKVLFYSWFNVSLRPCSSLFPPLSCFHTSVITWWRSSTAGCKGEGSAVRARKAAARTALALWATTAGSPARIVCWMVRSYCDDKIKRHNNQTKRWSNAQ